MENQLFRNKYRIESIRLSDWDYSSNAAYYITICTKNRECLFGEICNGQNNLNRYGKIVFDELIKTPNIRQEIILDEFIIMPNHIHVIVIINNVETTGRVVVETTGRLSLQQKRNHPNGPGKRSIGSFIAGFKSITTKLINQIRKMPGTSVWQENYYESIIRNEKQLNIIREYIINNPLKWGVNPS